MPPRCLAILFELSRLHSPISIKHSHVTLIFFIRIPIDRPYSPVGMVSSSAIRVAPHLLTVSRYSGRYYYKVLTVWTDQQAQIRPTFELQATNDL